MQEFLLPFENFHGAQDMLLNFISTSGQLGIIIASAGLDGLMQRILSVIRLVAILLAIVGLMYAAYQLNSGDIRAALLGVLAAGLMGASYIIVVALFPEAGSGTELEVFLEF